jgi:hypothetical protein
VEDCGQVEAGDAAVDLLRAAACGRGNTAPTRGLGSSSRDIAPSVSSRRRAPRLGGLLNIARQGVQAVREDTTCLDWPDLGVTSGIADPLCLLVGKVLHAKLFTYVILYLTNEVEFGQDILQGCVSSYHLHM